MTRQQLAQLLTGPRAKKKCPYKGVSWASAQRGYVAAGTKDGKCHYFGYSKDPAAAAGMYNAGIERLFPGVPKYLNPVKPKQDPKLLLEEGLRLLRSGRQEA